MRACGIGLRCGLIGFDASGFTVQPWTALIDHLKGCVDKEGINKWKRGVCRWRS